MRRTKIVATLGPATGTRERIAQLIEAGVDVVRLNCSHGSHAEHAERIALVREEATRLARPVAILLDLQGPKIRTGELVDNQPVELVEGQRFGITNQEIVGDARCVSTSYTALPYEVAHGDRILISDGLIELRVDEVTDREVWGEVIHGGELRERQGINLPGVNISSPAVTEKDIADLHFGLEQGADYVAISFVRRAEDVVWLKEIIARAGKDTPVIAKLEKPEALDCLDEIIQVADGVMVARGDLGVETSPEQVPLLQKRIIAAANRAAKPVITATQMLESMIQNAQPTRAEASDVANAILDGTDAIMLSGETAIGAHPMRAVRMMARIADVVETSGNNLSEPRSESWVFDDIASIPQAIGSAVRAIVHELDVAAICVLTKTGSSARAIARFRPNIRILAYTPSETTYRRLNLLWGVTPIMTVFANDESQYYCKIQTSLLTDGLAREGDCIVLTGGHPIVRGGPTNFIKIFVLEPGHPTMVE